MKNNLPELGAVLSHVTKTLEDISEHFGSAQGLSLTFQNRRCHDTISYRKLVWETTLNDRVANAVACDVHMQEAIRKAFRLYHHEWVKIVKNDKPIIVEQSCRIVRDKLWKAIKEWPVAPASKKK